MDICMKQDFTSLWPPFFHFSSTHPPCVQDFTIFKIPNPPFYPSMTPLILTYPHNYPPQPEPKIKITPYHIHGITLNPSPTYTSLDLISYSTMRVKMWFMVLLPLNGSPFLTCPIHSPLEIFPMYNPYFFLR